MRPYHLFRIVDESLSRPQRRPPLRAPPQQFCAHSPIENRDYRISSVARNLATAGIAWIRVGSRSGQDPLFLRRIARCVRRSRSGEPALVFIHGLAGSHADFKAQMDHFEETHRVVGLDLPGYGDSDWDRFPWSFAAYRDDVASLVNSLDLEGSS